MIYWGVVWSVGALVTLWCVARYVGPPTVLGVVMHMVLWPVTLVATLVWVVVTQETR